MKIRRQRRRLVLGLALGLTAASALAGPAQARPELFEVNASDTNATPAPIVSERHADGSTFRYVSPVAVAATVAPDNRADRAVFGGGVEATPVATGDGLQIDWRDAGFGALGAAALIALMAGTLLLARSRRSGRLAVS